MNAISILGPEASAFHAELNQVAWVLDWQEAQQNLIDERKNRSIRCYAEGERQHGGGRKARIETYLPYAIPSILEKSFGRSRECHACSTVRTSIPLSHAWQARLRYDGRPEPAGSSSFPP